MTIDLWMLLAAAGLQWLLILAAASPNILKKGISWSVGPRDTDAKVTMPAWHGRLVRASQNLQENLVLFAVLVLVVHVAGKANATSALGAEIFLGARAASILYVGGIAWVRTLAWFVSLAGMAMVAYALL